jgi:hypothetical protein
VWTYVASQFILNIFVEGIDSLLILYQHVCTLCIQLVAVVVA